MTRNASAHLPPIVFFRNDDVNELTPELIELTALLVAENVPIIHTVEPGNVTEECVAWLLRQKAEHGRLVELMQHGWNHSWHGVGEFGGDRSYDDQYRDLSRGKQIMDDKFGDQWFPAVNFPFGPYNQDSIRIVGELGFTVFNGHFNPRLSRRLFYKVGRFLKRGQILGKHVSYHLENYARTDIFTIDVVLSYIKKYHGEHGSIDCDFHDLETLFARYDSARRFVNIIGWLLHHRFHHTPASMRLVGDSITELRSRVPDLEFWNFEEICRAHGRVK
ncbi:MAG: polysaccharide deacetylase family protein [bacterium]|nr:polysaccharide deacetylase family protein [bacterium]